MSDWQPIETAPANTPVLTKIDDERGVRNQQVLKHHSNLWWYADDSMYVYYRPTHWRPIADDWRTLTPEDLAITEQEPES